jgi:hypothetical protein
MDFRLTPEVYEKLEDMLPKPIVNAQTNEHQVGYLLGIQHVLSVLRKGFTIGSDTPRGASFQTGARPLRRDG